MVSEVVTGLQKPSSAPSSWVEEEMVHAAIKRLLSTQGWTLYFFSAEGSLLFFAQDCWTLQKGMGAGEKINTIL